MRATLSFLLIWLAAGSAHSESAYPVRPVRLIVPSAVGSPPDLMARVMGEKLAAAIGQPVVVDNRPGATGIVGLEAIAKSAPNGHTLGTMALPYVVNAILAAQVPFLIHEDFAPVVQVNWSYNALALPAASVLRTVPDLIRAAKANPGALRYASGGNGTPPHLAAQLLRRETGVELSHVPYKGTVAAVQALLSGEVDFIFGHTAAIGPFDKAGKLRVLATTAPQRIAPYPELPTFIELGFPGVHLRDWQGLVAPRGTPFQMINRVHAEVAKAAAMGDVRNRLDLLGMEPAVAGPQQFGEHIRQEARRWRKLVQEAGIKAD